MEQQQGEEGAAAGASEESISTRGGDKNSKEATLEDFVLLDLDLDQLDLETLERALANSPLRALEGPKVRLQALVELRLFAASLPKTERLDLLTYIIEERKLPVNTITEEERCYLESELVGEKRK